MRTMTVDDVIRQPQRLIDDARRGDCVNISAAGEPVLLALPLGKGIVQQATLLELAITLFDSEQISLGRAARIAGLAYSEMIDELGRRGIAVIRLRPGELERELAGFGHERA